MHVRVDKEKQRWCFSKQNNLSSSLAIVWDKIHSTPCITLSVTSSGNSKAKNHMLVHSAGTIKTLCRGYGSHNNSKESAVHHKCTALNMMCCTAVVSLATKDALILCRKKRKETGYQISEVKPATGQRHGYKSPVAPNLPPTRREPDRLI